MLEPTPTRDLDLQSVRVALTVAECLSFRQAGHLLRVRQSVVSRRIRALEDEIGISIFQRHARGVRLTHAGRFFLDRAAIALSELDYATKGARAAGTAARGQLRIGLFSSLASMFARQLIKTFIADHPGVEIQIEEGAPRMHVARIREHTLDIAFVTGIPEVADCDVAHLWNGRVFVVLPESHRLSSHASVAWNTLKNERFMVSHEEPGPEIHDYVIRKLAELGHHPQVSRHAVGRENLMNLVGLGLGVSLTSEATIAASYPEVVFRPIASPNDVLPFSAVWAPDRDNPALRRFVSLARSMGKDL